MNCKPGDLAVFVREARSNTPDKLCGMFCNVIKAAPMGQGFRLPNGQLQTPHRNPSWVVKLSRQIRVQTDHGDLRKSIYACVPDYALRPIRPQADDARDETLDWLPVPRKEHA
jgi:hypothetical protein